MTDARGTKRSLITSSTAGSSQQTGGKTGRQAGEEREVWRWRLREAGASCLSARSQTEATDC